MKLYELDLEEVIFSTDRETLEERGLHVRGKMFRQLRIGKYGVADLVTFETYPNVLYGGYQLGRITVYELKRDKVGISAFLQALRYIKGIRRFLIKRGYCDLDFEYKIVLIGKKVDKESDFIYLPSFLCDDFFSLDLYEYRFDINGFRFDYTLDYCLKNEGF